MNKNRELNHEGSHPTTSLLKELEFFESFGIGNKGEQPSNIGIFTTRDLCILTTLYPEIIKGMLLLYLYMERPQSPEAKEAFLSRLVLNRFYAGQLMTDADIAQLRKDMKGGVYSEQLELYRNRTTNSARFRNTQANITALETKLLKTGREDKNQQKKQFGDYGRLETTSAALNHKRMVLGRIIGLGRSLQTLYGETDYKKAFMTELILKAPFVNMLASGKNIDEEAKKRHWSYLMEALQFSDTFDPFRQFQVFEELTKQFSAEWTEELGLLTPQQIDQEFMMRVYQISSHLLEREEDIDGVYQILKETLLRRGRIFKIEEVEIFGKTQMMLTPTTTTQTGFEEIGGYAEQKGFYLNLLTRLKSKDPLLDTLRIVMAAGKPGLGKSLGVRAFLSSLPENARGIIIEPNPHRAEVRSPYQDIVTSLAMLHPDLHIFAVFEDMDTIAGDRTRNLYTRNLLRIDSVMAAADDFPLNLHIIGTTNKLEEIDPAILRPGRTSKIIVYEPPKDLSVREEITRIHAKFNSLALDEETIALIASKAEGLTPDEIRHIVWSIGFEGLSKPAKEDIARFIAEIKNKHRLEKRKPGFTD